MTTTTQKTAQGVYDSLGLSVEFGPPIGTVKPRDNAKGEDWPCVEWNVTFTKGANSETFRFFAGIGNVPWQHPKVTRAIRVSYGEVILLAGHASPPEHFGKIAEAQRQGNHGKPQDAKAVANAAAFVARLTGYTPKPWDVLHCITLDSSAIEMTFEEWCGESGMDTDSRKAERLFHECAETGKRLLRLIGRNGIESLRNSNN